MGKFNNSPRKTSEGTQQQTTEKSKTKSRIEKQKYYNNKNYSGSASAGRYFTQVRKKQTIKAFEKHFKDDNASNSESRSTGEDFNRKINGFFQNKRKRPPPPPKVYDSLQAKKKKLLEAQDELQNKWHMNKVEATRKRQEREQKQKMWIEKKKKRGEINRLMNKKTSRGQPSMKAMSKALLMKIEQKMAK